MKTINANVVLSLLRYEPETGKFYWLIAKGNRRIGYEAGTVNSWGYVSIALNRQKYQAHRLAWVFMTGDEPEDEIDHINGIRSDNRWVNLREATTFENHVNVPMSKRNTSGLKGVGLHRGRWRAKLNSNGKCIHIGYFQTPEEAYVAYRKAADFHHGKFANHET
ncbi:MAG: HNH endonuclease [Rhodanobacter sp.]